MTDHPPRARSGILMPSPHPSGDTTDIPHPDPITSPTESSLPASTWTHLARWLNRYNQTRSAGQTLRSRLSCGRVATLYGPPDLPSFQLTSSPAPGFTRLWRARPDELFPEDLSHPADFLVLAARQDTLNTWHDLTLEESVDLIDTLRWLTLRRWLHDKRAA